MTKPETSEITDEVIEAWRSAGDLRDEIADPAVPGLRLRITKGGGTWFLLEGGAGRNRKRLMVGAWPDLNVDEARARALSLRRRLRDPNSGPATVTDLIDAYQLFKSPSLARGPQTVRAIRDILGPVNLRNPELLVPREISGLVRARAVTAPSNANRQLAYVKAMFGWAKAQGLVENDPAAGIPKPARERPRERTPTMDEVVQIWEAACARPEPYSTIVRLLILTGCRRDEVGHMRVDELTFDKGEVGPVWTLPAERTKNGRALRIPLSTQARELIDGLVNPDAEWVFTVSGDKPFAGWSRAKSALDSTILLDDHKFPAWKLHDLRRAFATYACDELGSPREVVDRCLNHIGAASTSAVSRVYIRSELFAARRDLLQAWGDAVTRAVEAAPSTPETGTADAATIALRDLVETISKVMLAKHEPAPRADVLHQDVIQKVPTAPPAIPTHARTQNSEAVLKPKGSGTPPFRPPPGWSGSGGWVQEWAPRGSSATILFRLGEPPREPWWRAIWKWARDEGLEHHYNGYWLYLDLTGDDTRRFMRFLTRVRGLPIRDELASSLDPSSRYLICGWCLGEDPQWGSPTPFKPIQNT